MNKNMRCENLFQNCLVCKLTLNGKVSPLNRMLSYYWRQMVEVQFSQISSFSLFLSSVLITDV